MDVCNFEQTVRRSLFINALWLCGRTKGLSAPMGQSNLGGCVMVCPSCQSVKQAEFTAEMIVHSPGLKNIDRPGVWLFPELRVCLDCGFCRFTVSEADLASVTEGNLTDKSSTVEESATQR